MNRIRTALGFDRDAEEGMTLVEVIVAMLVFSIITVGAVVSIGTVLTMTSDSRAREVAANLAAQDVDAARSTPDVFDVQATKAPIVTTQNGTTFSLSRKVNWVSTTGISSQCGAAGGTLLNKQVNVTVTWGTGTPSQTVTTNTLLAPNSKINDPDFGTILVTVASGVGLGATSGVSVTITPDSTVAGNTAVALGAQPDATDNNGCAFALKVSPGSYTVTLSPPQGQYRDQAQAANPVQSVSVGAGGSASAIFAYDPAAAYTMTYAANYKGAATLPSNLATTWLSNLPTYTTSTPAATQYLSPNTSGYTAIVGQYAPATAAQSCVDLDPSAWPKASDGAIGTANPLLPASSGATAKTDVSPTMPQGALPMGVVKVAVASSVRIVNVVTAAVPMGDDPGCKIPQSYTYAVTPAASGGKYYVTLAVPFGTWTLTTQTSAISVPSAVLWTDIALLTRGTSALALTLNKVTLDPRTAP